MLDDIVREIWSEEVTARTMREGGRSGATVRFHNDPHVPFGGWLSATGPDDRTTRRAFQLDTSQRHAAEQIDAAVYDLLLEHFSLVARHPHVTAADSAEYLLGV